MNKKQCFSASLRFFTCERSDPHKPHRHTHTAQDRQHDSMWLRVSGANVWGQMEAVRLCLIVQNSCSHNMAHVHEAADQHAARGVVASAVASAPRVDSVPRTVTCLVGAPWSGK